MNILYLNYNLKTSLFSHLKTIPLRIHLGWLFIIAVFPGVFISAIDTGSESHTNDSDKTQTVDHFSSFQTAFFTIYYEPGVDLNKVYRKLNMRHLYVSQWENTPELIGINGKLANRINMLLQAAKEILGMYPKTNPLTIIIFKDSKDLFTRYTELTRKSLEVQAFYYDEINTVFTAEDLINDSVLAHEIAHFIIHQYYDIAPPEKISEMMAINVDENLEGRKPIMQIFRKEFRKK